MPPRRFRATRPQPTLVTPPTDNARPRRARTRAPVNNHVEGESIDLDDISSGDDDDDIQDDNPDPTYNPAADSNNPTDPHNRAVAGTSRAADVAVNNPDLPVSKLSTVADIHYFYKEDDKHMVCVECK